MKALASASVKWEYQHQLDHLNEQLAQAVKLREWK